VVRIDPQQEIFSTIRKAIEELGYSVYDAGMPPKGTPYPLVYLGYTQQNDTLTKSQINGTVYQQVDIWHSDARQRGTVSAMALAIKRACFALTHTASFSIGAKLNDQSIQPDDSSGITLLRCMLEFKITFS